jgi:hypothetical protein
MAISQGVSQFIPSHRKMMHFRGQSAGLPQMREDFDMSKMEHEFHLAVAASRVPRRRSSIAKSGFPPERRIMRRSESPLFDGVIAFPQAPGSRGWDATGNSKNAHFRQRRHASLSSENTTKSHEVNSGKSKAAPQSDDDHHQRILENLLAAAALILLIIAGAWIFSTLVKMP